MFGMNGKPIEPLTDVQIKQLRSNAFGKEALALVIGLNTGIGFSELIALANTDINISHNTIFIRNNKQSRVVYLTPGAMEEIGKFMKKLNSSIEVLFQYSDITFKPVLDKWSSTLMIPVTWQVIRHTYGRYADRVGIPQKLAAHNIGVSEKLLEVHYSLTPQKISNILRNKEKL